MTPLGTALTRCTDLADLVEKHPYWRNAKLKPPRLVYEARRFVGSVAVRTAIMPSATYVNALNDAEEVAARLERILAHLDPFEALFYPHTSDGEVGA